MKYPALWKRATPKTWCIVELYGDGTWRPNRAAGTFTVKRSAREFAAGLVASAKRRREAAIEILGPVIGFGRIRRVPRYRVRIVRCEIVPMVPGAERLSEEDLKFSPLAVNPHGDT